jgi:Uma2 family endonuclease
MTDRLPLAEYWIVDVDAQIVERWRPDDERPEIAADELLWTLRAKTAGLSIDLPALFSRVLDDGLRTGD